jgi:PmbA protein
MGELTRAEEIVERALSLAEGDEADAFCILSDRSLTRFAESRLHQNMAERSASLTIRVIVDGRSGVASTSSVDPEAIGRAAALARTLATRGERDPAFRGLHRSAPRASGDSFDEETAALTPRAKAESLVRIFDQEKPAGIRFAGSWATGSSAVATGNSHGVRQSAPATVSDASFIALTEDTSGFATGISRAFRGTRVQDLAREASHKALLSRGTTAGIPTGAVTVILEPPALAEIFEWLNTIAFNGQSMIDGSSFMSGNLGKAFLGENVSILDDAGEPELLPFPFDMEGLPKRRVPLVERGVIRTPLVDRYAADRLGVEPTASAASLGSEEHGIGLHLTMDGGRSSVEEMIAATERGIWITRFHYLNGLLDPKSAMMTGMTRDGTFLIEDGRLAGRLPNLRWTQSIVEAFRSIAELGRERRAVGAFWNPLGGTLLPAARIHGWRITGQTG